MKGVILVGSFDDFRDMFYNVYRPFSYNNNTIFCGSMNGVVAPFVYGMRGRKWWL